jgi:hypothetical protein
MGRYYTGTVSEQIYYLLESWRSICAALKAEVGDTTIEFPDRDSIRSIAH